eukprot:Blabericola_migrator_1__7986@NODE_409_length_8743_cov_452_402259_g322_i0_p9_GENE_NODE_409_length_8743_cov_452_402259_g322_i0NODE_409_length_8743_cov_452_402259_g322_i0_p9_ORF_typecomplete_len138_score17_03Sec5/PF15469_6/0_0028_NODE_409_length_8743_cov_452_402259_g322_i055715984
MRHPRVQPTHKADCRTIAVGLTTAVTAGTTFHEGPIAMTEVFEEVLAESKMKPEISWANAVTNLTKNPAAIREVLSFLQNSDTFRNLVNGVTEAAQNRDTATIVKYMKAVPLEDLEALAQKCPIAVEAVERSIAQNA